VSPLKVHKKPALVADSDSELTETDDSGLEAKRKGLKGDKKTDNGAGKRAFRAMVQEKRTMTTTANNKRTLIKPAGNLKVRISTSNF
jgi:hypothetical protein